MHPASIASSTIFFGSKYSGLAANDAPAGALPHGPPVESTDTLSRPVDPCYTASACYAARQAADCYPPSHGRRNHVRAGKVDQKEWSYNDAVKVVGVFAKQLRNIGHSYAPVISDLKPECGLS